MLGALGQALYPALETGSWAVHVHLTQTVNCLARDTPHPQCPAFCGGQRQKLEGEESPQGAKSHPQATAHLTTFTRLGPASAHRLLQAQAVAETATVARQTASLLGRSGEQE